MERAAQYDEALARDIKDYVHGRKYGLVYEASKPEFVRMWKKPVVCGDLVNILPPRGVMEDTKNDDDSSEIVYKVIDLSDGRALLRNEQTNEIVETAVNDIVALARFDKPIYAGLKEICRIERGGNKPYHVVINGENYHALQTLVYAYQGSVDCIYIDPPYNTGAKDWKYNNNYVGEQDEYRHSKWLTFIEDRLKLAKKLLNPLDSVLIITIDEKEYLRLGLLLEQLFPQGNIQMVSTVINGKGVARENEFSRVNEYIYFVRIGECSVSALPLSDEWLGNIKTTTTKKVRWGSLMRSGSGSDRSDSPGCFYPIFISEDKKHICGVGDVLPLGSEMKSVIVPKGQIALFPIHSDGREGRWQYSPKKFLEIQRKGYVRISTQTNRGVTLRYIAEGWQKRVESGQIKVVGRAEDGSLLFDDGEYVQKFIPSNQWQIPAHDATEFGSKELNKIVEKRFSFPKSLYAVHDTIRFFVKNKPEALIVDFFAGSGTTAHAVSLLNAEDAGRRRCICVTNNEVSAAEIKALTEQKLRPGDPEWEQYGIAHYVTWPRINCAIKGMDINGRPLQGNYGYLSEFYEEYVDGMISEETGERVREKLYKKVKIPSYPELANLRMSDGFEENAIFFDLEYLEPSVVSANLAFEHIAPILWLCGGCEGEILQRCKGYVIGKTYAILFDPRYKRRFVDIVIANKSIDTIFIVTDVAERYRSLCTELPGRRVMQLYESYLRSFEINAIG